MDKRYLGAAILAPFLIFLFLGGMYLKGLVFVLSLLGMYEFYKVIERKNIHAIKPLGYALCIAYFFNLEKAFDSNMLIYLLIAAVFVCLCIPVINVKYTFVDSAVTILGFIYVAVFFSFIVLVNNKPDGKYLIWLIFISSWVCDTGAYYSGRYFGKGGKHKLCPKVSPKKTVEGSIGGLFGSTIGCIIFGIIINNNFGVNIEIYHYMIIGFLNGIFGQFGDLAASSIKRYVGAKDYSNLIPGHGGILDRFDSILFASVVVFYYLTFILGI